MASTTNPTSHQDSAKKMQETASNLGDKARETAASVADRARGAASAAGSSAEDAAHAVGSRLESLGGQLRQNMPQEGALGSAGATLAGGLERSGRYLQEEGLSGMAEDLTNLIRRNPVPAVLVGLALGFMIARVTSRR